MYKSLSAPIRVDLELTSRCNLKCSHCYNYWRDDTEHEVHLSQSDLNKILIQLNRYNVFEITATGGEPFLNSNILLLLIKHCRKNGTTLSINSNLTLLNDKVVDLLKKYKIGVLTSIHSCNSDVHDRIVGYNGAFANTTKNIKLLLEKRIPVSVNMVLRQDNFEDLYATGDFVHDIGVRTFTAVRVSPPVYAKNRMELVLTRKQVKKSLDILLELNENLRLRTGNQNCYPLCLLGDTKKYEALTLRKCGAGAYHCAIGADGAIRPCVQGDMIYGNILTEDLSAIWQRMSDWQTGAYIPDKCRECKYLALCSTGCRSDSYISSGSLSGQDPYSSKPEDVIVDLKTPKRPKLNANDILFLPRLRFRDESFGVIVSPFSRQSRNTVVKHNTADILRLFQEKEFTLSEIADQFNIDFENATTFFTELAERRIVIRRRSSVI